MATDKNFFLLRFYLFSSLLSLQWTSVAYGQVVKRLLDKGELLSKTVEDVAQTKADAAENVVFMIVTGVVISVALIAAAVYFRKPSKTKS
ncbi:MAG: hypothetical protein HN985_06445 [Planctomycetaceae bacterium]|nr:hypothetical protein [Planctomycetaceae bacterium]MBT6642815.1 hypothetical protein [Planctomycetaceae bacterium]MBT6919346.1 hypothetical protein [Planctomycetaceae bacterium]